MGATRKFTFGFLTVFFGVGLLLACFYRVDDSVDQISHMENESQLETSTQFVHQELDQLASPFTRETVIELNEIVARSLAAIEAFDDSRKKVMPGKGIKKDRKLLVGLAQKAKQARDDMDAAGKRLLERGERYNEEIFDAMVRFVNRVDQEIQQEVDLYNEKFVEIDQS